MTALIYSAQNLQINTLWAILCDSAGKNMWSWNISSKPDMSLIFNHFDELIITDQASKRLCEVEAILTVRSCAKKCQDRAILRII